MLRPSGQGKKRLCALCVDAPVQDASAFCYECGSALRNLVSKEQFLDDLQKHIDFSGNRIVVLNVILRTNIPGEPAVAIIDTNGTPGVQFPIGLRGSAKCVICGEFTDSVVCDECMDGSIAARSLKRIIPSLLEMNDSRLLHLLQFILDNVSEDVAAQMVKRAIDGD